MITTQDLKDVGFEPIINNEKDYNLDEWEHKEKSEIKIRKYSELGYIIESKFIMSPVKTKQKLEIITNILLGD